MMITVKLLPLLVTLATARELSDEELHRLPKLFHLDDYDRCLSQKDGLYCVGSFELIPRTESNPVYALIQEHLKHPFSFDRRFLHRGYCLTSRCPADESNTTLRFEHCVAKLLRKQGLTARLHKLTYCTSQADRKTKEIQGPDLPQRIFLYAVYFLLFLNALGTCYDVFASGKKSSVLVAWSIPSNWKRMIAPYEGVEASFIPIQSVKIILYAMIIYGHCAILHYLVYSHNPELMEKQARSSSVLITIRNGTSIVQIFLLISSFLTGYNLLVAARRSPVTLTLITRWIMKRIFRIAPVFLLVTAYAATWWSRAGDGPLWAPTVEAESKLCRRKFWTHLLFINNLVEASELCMVQSWAMAADIQLYLVGLFLTLLFVKLHRRATHVLAALFVASCMYNITLAYTAGLEPMIRIIVPENIRIMFRESRTLVYLHLSPMSNLPACLFGLLVAHLCFEHQYKHKTKTELENNEIKNNSEENEHITETGETIIRDNRPLIENSKKINENGGPVIENGRKIYGNEPITNHSVKVDEFELNGVVYNGVGLRKRTKVKENFTNGLNNNNKQNGVSKRQTNEGSSTKNVIKNTYSVTESDIKTNGIQFNCSDSIHANIAQNCADMKTNGHIKSEIESKINGDIIKHAIEINTKGPITQNTELKTNGYIQQNGIELQNNRHIKQNGTELKNNGHIKQNGTELKTNGHVTQNGTKLNKNGHVKQNGTDLKTNGYFKQNGTELKTNGHVTQNGTELNKNGHVKQNGTELKTNGYIKQNGTKLKTNGHVSQNGTELKNNGHITQNGIDCKRKEESNKSIKLNTKNMNNQNGLTNLSDAGNKKENKAHFLLRYAHCFTFPGLFAWVILGSHIMSVESKLVIALYVGMERLIFSLMSAWQLIQIITIKGPWGELFSWPGWRVPGRLSLCMTMVHWCISATFVASRPLPVVSSVFSISVDWLTTLFYSYLAAIPLYVLVELPMRLSLDALIS